MYRYYLVQVAGPLPGTIIGEVDLKPEQVNLVRDCLVDIVELVAAINYRITDYVPSAA